MKAIATNAEAGAKAAAAGAITVEAANMCTSGKTGVLLMNTGTPDAPTAEAVGAYLGEFLMDDRIVPMNKTVWKCILNAFILPSRSKRSAEKYRSIWIDEGSPIMVYHQRLAAKLQKRFDEESLPFVVDTAMNYGSCSVKKALTRFEEAGCTSFIALPLYPQGAFSTTSASLDAVQRAASGSPWEKNYETIRDYAENSAYISAIAESIREAGFGQQEGDHLLFSFHSVPLADIQGGDSYECLTRNTSKRVAAILDLKNENWSMGYQCRFDRGRTWLSPFTKDILANFAANESADGKSTASGNARRVFLVCPNFAVDCLETLHDVPHDFEPLFENLVYVPCLNDRDSHVDALFDIIVSKPTGFC